jgi:excisionase family DNA binding protein
MTLVEKIASHRGALKVNDLVELLGCSKEKIYADAKSGRIPSFNLGSAVRFDPALVAAWLKKLTS